MLPAYQVVRTYPVHCPHTDGLIGTNTKRLNLVYHTQGMAHAKAAQLHVNNPWGDDSYEVIEIATGKRVLSPYRREILTDECPW